MEYSILAYYAIAKIEDPAKEVLRHKDFFKTRDFRGRIYISEQGINGQASGKSSDAQEYIDWLNSDPRFKDVSFKTHFSSTHVFPKMTVKFRHQLVAIDCDVDFSDKGESLSPIQWKEMLQSREPNSLIIDVRNDYEWKAGHFEGAELPQLNRFREFPDYAKNLKQRVNPETTPIMMYCTGGIRCDFFSPILKKEGFKRVYQLEGGVIQYGLEQGSDLWKGKLFVFDDRLVIPLDEQAESIATCSYCAISCDVYYNCANVDCNQLFFCCLDCLRTHRGCCSDPCQTGRIRPYKEDAIPFRKMRCDCAT